MKSFIIKKLGTKKSNLLQFALISSLILNNKVGLNNSVLMLAAVKISILYFGVIAGMGLQQVFLEMKTRREKLIHLSLITTIMLLATYAMNWKNF